MFVIERRGCWIVLCQRHKTAMTMAKEKVLESHWETPSGSIINEVESQKKTSSWKDKGLANWRLNVIYYMKKHKCEMFLQRGRWTTGPSHQEKRFFLQSYIIIEVISICIIKQT